MTQIGEANFTYCLSASDVHNQLCAELGDARITIYMPEATAGEWVNGNTVGYSAEMPVPGNKRLYLLVEKDFKCLDNTIEDQSDNYPNPLAEKR